MPSLAMTACGGTLPSRKPGTLALLASFASDLRWISLLTFLGTLMSSAIADCGSWRTSHLSTASSMNGPPLRETAAAPWAGSRAPREPAYAAKDVSATNIEERKVTRTAPE